MSERDIALIDELRTTENALVEFKKDNIDPKLIAKLCSALSNAARIEEKDFAYVMWGIDDATHEVVGTRFNPDDVKAGSNTVLQLWLAQHLKPSIAFEFRRVAHPDGAVVLLEIPVANIAPVSFDDIAYVRIGSTTPKLTDYPERQQKLISNLRPYIWEKGVAKRSVSSGEVLDLLDYPSYLKLTQQPFPDSKSGILERLAADQLIDKDVGGRWDITNLGAILFASDLGLFDSSLARKAIRFVAYKGTNRAAMVTHREDSKKGYAAGLGELLGYINGLLPVNEHIGEAFREDQPLFPKIAIRELIANALIHQDMTITGAGPQVELFEGRMEITNPGSTLVSADRMIDLPPRSRNAMLGSMMRRMQLCEERGSGLDKVIASVEIYQLPPPRFQAEVGSMQVILYAPRMFADMTFEERIRACYQHAVLKYLSDEKMKNASLCERLGIEKKNAAQASKVFNATLKKGLIKLADPENVRMGYLPWWA